MILQCQIKTGPREESVTRKWDKVIFGPALNAKEEREEEDTSDRRRSNKSVEQGA
jgi:hypothetical protein